jgi:hypothetical protein
MKKSFHPFKVLSAYFLAISMVMNPLYAPSAIAADRKSAYNEVCAKADAGKTGANASAECSKAKVAMTTAQVEKQKMVMFGAAASVAAVLALQEWVPISAPIVKAACTVLSMGTSIGGMLMDKQGESTNGEIVGKFAATTSQMMGFAGLAGGALSSMGGGALATKVLGSKFTDGVTGVLLRGDASTSAIGKSATNAVAKAGKNGVALTSKAATDEAKKKLGDAKMGCLSAAGMLGVQASFSAIGNAGAGKVFSKTLDSARTVIAAAGSSVTKVNFNANGHPADADNSMPGSASNSKTSETCEGSNGNDYIKCMGTQSPEIAAISNNPDFIGIMEKAMGGKSLGDFVKGFNGETKEDAQQYIGNALGMSAPTIAKIMDAGDQIAKETGALEKYQASGYTRAPSSVASKGDAAPDFNALMAGLLKQLDPAADGAKKDDAAELVFRQLDLLPAEKIEQSKEISLFARIGFRYRKNSTNLEHLNWSVPQNQASSK